MEVSGITQRLAQQRRPKLSIGGKYSIPFTTAVMMVKGNVTLRDYTEDGLRDSTVLAMADQVSYRADPNAALPRGGNSSLSRPTVEIRLKDGRVLSRQVEGVPGDPSLAPKNINAAIELIGHLESVADVAEITRLLAPALTG